MDVISSDNVKIIEPKEVEKARKFYVAPEKKKEEEKKFISGAIDLGHAISEPESEEFSILKQIIKDYIPEDKRELILKTFLKGYVQGDKVAALEYLKEALISAKAPPAASTVIDKFIKTAEVPEKAPEIPTLKPKKAVLGKQPKDYSPDLEHKLIELIKKLPEHIRAQAYEKMSEMWMPDKQTKKPKDPGQRSEFLKWLEGEGTKAIVTQEDPDLPGKNIPVKDEEGYTVRAIKPEDLAIFFESIGRIEDIYPTNTSMKTFIFENVFSEPILKIVEEYYSNYDRHNLIGIYRATRKWVIEDRIRTNYERVSRVFDAII